MSGRGPHRDSRAGTAVATLTAVAPASGDIGVEVLLTATGMGFADGDVIAYGIEDLATTFVDATSLTAPVTPIDPGPHDVLVRCADGDTNAVVFDATGTAPVDPVDLDTLMQQLKDGDTSGLPGADDNGVISSRQLYKQWTDGEIARLKDEYLRCYNAIVAELAKRGLTGGT